MPIISRLARQPRSFTRGLLIGGAAFAAAFLVRWMAGPAALPFPTFFLAVLFTAVCAGWQAALGVTILSFGAVWYFFLPPFQLLQLTEPDGVISLGFFLLVCLAQIWLVETLHRAAAEVVRSRERIAALLQQERHLYHELQHRVANSIQSLASILSIQASAITDPEDASQALADAVQRLLGVAAVHRRLHDPELSGSSLAEAMDGLIRDLLRSVGREDISIEVACTVPPLDPTVANLVAMIVAEATMNSIKHGFAGRPGGRLSIALHQDAGENILTIADNGLGLAPHGSTTGPRLGTTIMRGFADRLEGSFVLEPAPYGGAQVRVNFPSSATSSGRPR